MSTTRHYMDAPVHETGTAPVRESRDGATMRESKEAVVEDLKKVIEDAQNLLAATTTHSREALTEKATQAKAKLRQGIEGLRDFERRAADQAQSAAERTEESIRTHPWTAVGVTALVALALGRMTRNHH